MSERIALYLMNRKGLAVLEAMLKEIPSAMISHIVSASNAETHDKSENEIEALATKHKIPFVWREHPEIKLARSLALAAGWRWMIRDEPKLIVLHDSLLPKYRGFNPLVTALCNGDTEIGVTALWADEHYDTGPIISQMRREISYPVTIDAAIDAIVPLYRQLATDIARCVREGRLPDGMPQNETEASYSLWRDAKDYFIDWSKDAASIARMIDAVGYPYKGAVACAYGKGLLRVKWATPLPDVTIANRIPGKVLRLFDGMAEVVCGSGILRIEEVAPIENDLAMPKISLRTRFGEP